MESLINHTKAFGTLFYAVNPYETMFEKKEDLPHPSWTVRAIPYFLCLLLTEHFVLILKGKRGIRWNDGIMSAATGMMMLLKDTFLKAFLMELYITIYERYRLVDLPWDSLITWILAALAADLAYYWAHRASHELNILWAAHQVHHSSEELNLMTALRQSVFQRAGMMPLYMPAALLIPPTQILVHMQFNTLYQFWIHTELIGSLGPLEHVLNTAQHHRVHHGSNRYCLDKNYAGVLIVWDRLFGTFEWERPNEKIAYGLVDQPQFFNPLKHQIFYYVKIWKKAESMSSWTDRVWAFLKGPGWFPGTLRLGDPLAVPEVPNRAKYNPKVPAWVTYYCFLHFLLCLLIFQDLSIRHEEMSLLTASSTVSFLLWSLTSLGLLFDKSENAWLNEVIRCVVFLFGANLQETPSAAMLPIMSGAYAISLLLASAASLTRPAVVKKTE